MTQELPRWLGAWLDDASSFDEALVSAQEIRDGEERDNAYCAIGQALRKSGQFDAALATVGRVDDGKTRDEELLRMVSDLSQPSPPPFEELAPPEVLRRVARNIDRPLMRATAWEKIARLECTIGANPNDAFREAIQIVLDIENSMDRDAALRRIARVQASVGVQTDALATARLIDSPYFRAHALTEVAIAQVRGGLDAHATMAEAAQTAMAVAESEERQRLIRELKRKMDDEGVDIPVEGL